MSEFRFADPAWAHALWAVLGFALLLAWLERRRGGALDRLVAAALLRRLVSGPAAWRRRLRIVLLSLSAACLVVALMRPQLGLRHEATTRVGAEIMIALDVSKSMLAEDVAPNRLERAKAEIVDLLAYLEDDQVGLIAFAGRATVLAPLTPDFSFLRLVLAGAGPQSVSRGGTRLEEPIRKAVAGFGDAGEASRALLLITDGEDHDSFPLDAAAEAAEAGIVIIAIGFGDEDGSEIYVTDPRTGARELVRDGDGRPVRSRLDGDMLRDLALATGGAYVPAGTGVLDLESIFRQHIEGLTVGRLDPRGRTVRDEGYQWAVLLALIFLVSGVAVASGGRSALAALLAAVFVSLVPPPAFAQDPAGEPDAASADAPAADAMSPPHAEAEPDADAEAAEPEPATPREAFNRGVAALQADEPEEAQRWLERARREAGGDGELRFRAAYDLGLASVTRAEQRESEAPEEALRALYTAADWFREAVAQRPDEDDPRVNLDVALRRAMLLADKLAKADDKGVDASLAELAARQREQVAGLAGLLERVSEAPEVLAADQLRREFRAQATAQRAILGDGDQLAGEIEAERQAIASRPEEERSPEEQMREAQLEGALHYLHRARERMGQSRRQLRQRQAQRAFRRAASALGELKRALDQLRDPVAFLDALIAEATRTANDTAALGAARGQLPGIGADQAPAVPSWLDSESLRDAQQSIVERTGELDQRLLAGLEQLDAAPPEQAAMLESIRAAEPLVAKAQASFEAAVAALESDDPLAALEGQGTGVVALSDARERFLDLRGLIEATYADERRIASLLTALDDDKEPASTARAEYLPGLRELQVRNIERSERLEEQLLREAEALNAPQPAPDGSEPDPETLAIQRQRFDLAGQLLTLALARMDDVRQRLGTDDADGAKAVAPKQWTEAVEAGTAAVSQLEMLRRLFFSIVEELRDTLRQQVDLADATQEVAGLVDPAADEAPAQLGPLLPRQQALAERAGVIANALDEQSSESGGVLEEEADGWETSRRLRLAAEHVVLAQTEMEGASTHLAAEPAELAPTGERQAVAVSELEQALAQLVPPEERQQDQGGQGQQQQAQAQEGPGDEEQQQEQQGPPADPAQLLQAVRDREAERRRERDQRGTAGYETVEKDW